MNLLGIVRNLRAAHNDLYEKASEAAKNGTSEIQDNLYKQADDLLIVINSIKAMDDVENAKVEAELDSDDDSIFGA